MQVTISKTSRIWLFLLPWLVFQAWPAWAATTLRIGLTPAFLNERHALMADWRAYLERKLGRPVAFVLKDSYQETLELLHQQQIQVAWLCDCPHVTGNSEFHLLATPLFQGRPYYRSYVIVPKMDLHTRGLLDLKDKVFAFSDPYSNAGYMQPRYELKKLGLDPDHFFRRTFFTRSHRKAIEAVAIGVADAASVNSYIWETLDRQSPALTGKTRIAERSEEFGFPPFVAYHTVPVEDVRALQQALTDMTGDPQGREVLRQMNLDGFIPPRPELYQPIREVVRYMEQK
jgi:phosphonate transport system substrate-binding protein